MNTELFAAYLLISLIILLTPGPIVTLVIATGATQGARAALITVAGTTVGNVILIGAIALGLGIVLKFASELFEIMRWAGAAYLVWLGIQAWRSAGAPEAAPPRHRVHFSRGMVVALTNPKTIAFFTAFLPQFVDPNLSAGFQLTVMCIAWFVLAGITDSIWAFAAGWSREWFLDPVRKKWLGRVSGLALIGGGIWLSLVRRPG
jgi:threonine/homoserine/homoserine lactone efflux protein